MTPLEIKFLVFEQFGTITACAQSLGCYREELSMCIRRVREYPHIRQKLANVLGKSIEQLFGNQTSQKAA